MLPLRNLTPRIVGQTYNGCHPLDRTLPKATFGPKDQPTLCYGNLVKSGRAMDINKPLVALHKTVCFDKSETRRVKMSRSRWLDRKAKNVIGSKKTSTCAKTFPGVFPVDQGEEKDP